MNFRFTNTAGPGRIVPREEEAQALKEAGMTERQVKAYLAHRDGAMSGNAVAVSHVYVIPSRRLPSTPRAITTTVTSGAVVRVMPSRNRRPAVLATQPTKVIVIV